MASDDIRLRVMVPSDNEDRYVHNKQAAEGGETEELRRDYRLLVLAQLDILNGEKFKGTDLVRAKIVGKIPPLAMAAKLFDPASFYDAAVDAPDAARAQIMHYFGVKEELLDQMIAKAASFLGDRYCEITKKHNMYIEMDPDVGQAGGELSDKVHMYM